MESDLWDRPLTSGANVLSINQSIVRFIRCHSNGHCSWRRTISSWKNVGFEFSFEHGYWMRIVWCWVEDCSRSWVQRWKMHDPQLCLLLGMKKTDRSELVHRFRRVSLMVSMSVRYVGVQAFRQRYTSSKISYLINASTRSQCRFFRICSTWTYFRTPTANRAAQFCTFWSLWSCLFGRACRRTFPMSSLLVTKACPICLVASGVRSPNLWYVAQVEACSPADWNDMLLHRHLIVKLHTDIPNVRDAGECREMIPNVNVGWKFFVDQRPNNLPFLRNNFSEDDWYTCANLTQS